MINKKLTELIRDANREITPADRHSILDLIEQQSARIAELSAKCRLYEASLDKADREADGMKKDAERYRVLRDPTQAADGTVFACVHMHAPGTIPSQKHAARETLDVYCDAAIAKEKK